MHPPVGASTMSSPPGPQASRLRTLIRWLLRLYPRAWRERYADEITLVLAAHRVTLWTALDMLLGALDARLHPDLLPGTVVSVAQRLRNSEVAVFCAVVLFCLAWLPLRLVRDPL